MTLTWYPIAEQVSEFAEEESLGYCPECGDEVFAGFENIWLNDENEPFHQECADD